MHAKSPGKIPLSNADGLSEFSEGRSRDWLGEGVVLHAPHPSPDVVNSSIPVGYFVML